MELKTLEVYSEASNHAIVRVGGRRFPGSVVQGDSLNVLCSEARKIAEFVKGLALQDEDLLSLVQQHQENLLWRLIHYQRVLKEHGIELPYPRPVSEQDLVQLLADDDPESDGRDKD